jgi:predicted lactoylglutathione lyase
MYLVEDIADSRRHYEALGFEPKLTDEKGCVGVTAGPTGVILLDHAYAARSLPERALVLLQQKPALYVWVESLERVAAEQHGEFLGETCADGLREWSIQSPWGLMVFAETTAAASVR